MKNPFENPGKFIKNTLMATVATVAMLAPMESRAGNGGGNNKAGIENLEQERPKGGVGVKLLKKIVSGYEASPGSSFEMFVDSHPDGSFTVTESVGQTHSAAKLSAEQKLSAEHKTSRFTFTKKIGNGNVSVILVAIEK